MWWRINNPNRGLSRSCLRSKTCTLQRWRVREAQRITLSRHKGSAVLGKIAAFEARYQLRSPLFFVGFALFFILTFGAVTNDNIHIGSSGNVNINSPFAILQTTGIMDVFGV